MNLTTEIRRAVDHCVLCWLATASSDNFPNVSPKEVFACYGVNKIIIANIASPQSVRNITQNKYVCVSFIDIFVQKGFQIKGSAQIIRDNQPEFLEREAVLLDITKGKYPFASIIEVSMETAKSIIAPSYLLYPETTLEQRVKAARASYGV